VALRVSDVAVTVSLPLNTSRSSPPHNLHRPPQDSIRYVKYLSVRHVTAYIAYPEPHSLLLPSSSPRDLRHVDFIRQTTSTGERRFRGHRADCCAPGGIPRHRFGTQLSRH